MVDGVSTIAQGKCVGRLGAEGVVGVVACHLTEGGIALYPDKGLECLHAVGVTVCHGAGGVSVLAFLAFCGQTCGHGLGIYLKYSLVYVMHFPYEYEADEDRVAVAVIDLNRIHVDVAGP